MGTEMQAFVEYDETVLFYQTWGRPAGGPPEPPEPFSSISQELGIVTESVTDDGGLYTGSKNYVFFAAIAGVRNDTGIPELFSPRGLPPSPSEALKCYIDKGEWLAEYGIGWLTLSEINAALDHQRTNREHIEFEIETILFLLANLESRLGRDRARLVFGFWG